MTDRIEFYRRDDPWGDLSNFSRHPVEIDGEVWPTSEHYFQAQKFDDPGSRERIRQASGPGQAARLGRGIPGLRADWEQIKDEVMLRALRAKFEQHPGLTRVLLSTGNALLVEHTHKDRYWADGGDGSGLNRLGTLLMQVRDELRARTS